MELYWFTIIVTTLFIGSATTSEMADAFSTQKGGVKRNYSIVLRDALRGQKTSGKQVCAEKWMD